MKAISPLYFSLLFYTAAVLSCTGNAQQSDLSVSEFEKGISAGNIQLLDVRTPGEYESGHLKNSMLADWNNQKEFTQRAAALDKSKPVYVYCLAGGRSSAAAAWLKQNGYTAYNLNGGISAWKKQNKLVEQDTPATQITLQDYLAKIPADTAVLVDFTATWCPPCKKMNPIVDSLVTQMKSKFILVKIDGGQQTEICRQMNINGFPTFIIYKNGKETWRKEGIVEYQEFVKQL